MKSKFLSIAFALTTIACNNAKNSSGGGAVSLSEPVITHQVVETIVEPGSTSTTPTNPAEPQSKFCQKGQTYKLSELSIRKKLIDSGDEKLISDRPAYIYFQEGNLISKDDIDETKIHCAVRIHVKKRILLNINYKVAGEMTPLEGLVKADGKAICEQALETPPTLKAGHGFFDGITCSGDIDSNYKVEDVIAAIGEENLKVEVALAK